MTSERGSTLIRFSVAVEYLVSDICATLESFIKKMRISLRHFRILMIEEFLQGIKVNLAGTGKIRCKCMAKIMEPELLTYLGCFPDPGPNMKECDSASAASVRENPWAIRQGFDFVSLLNDFKCAL